MGARRHARPEAHPLRARGGRAALARRGAADALDPVLEFDGGRRELQTRVEEGRARWNAVSAEVAEAKRSAKGDPDAAARADGLIVEMRGPSARGIKRRRGARRGRGGREELARPCRTCPTRRRPTGSEEDAVGLGRSASGPASTSTPATTWSSASGLIDMETARRGLRLPLRLPARRRGARRARAGPPRARPPERRGSCPWCHRCWCAGARSTGPASSPSERT